MLKLALLLVAPIYFITPIYLAAQPPLFTIQDLGTLPNLPACNGTALSQSGNVVGYCSASAGQNLVLSSPPTHAFLYSKGAMTDLNVPTLTTPIPIGVNDSNTVVGGQLNINYGSATASASPFIYEKGQYQGIPGQLENALPFGLNNAGQIPITAIQVNAELRTYFIESGGFLYPLAGGAITPLTAPGGGTAALFAVSPNGSIAGASLSSDGTTVTPLLWQNQMPQTLPFLAGFVQGVATSINDSGVAAGIAFNLNLRTLVDPTATSHAVQWDNGSVTDLGTLPGFPNSLGTGINASGSIVGFSSTGPPDATLQLAALVDPPSSKYHAFIYTGGQMYDLNNQLVGGSGWLLSFATQINDAGQIVGTGLFSGSNGTTVQHAFLLTPAPGPSINNIVGAGFSTPAVTSISANGVFTIFGSGFTGANAYLTSSDIFDNQLPTNLGGTCVESGTNKWGLFFVGPGQVNALAGQLPATGTVPVTVVTNCGTANEIPTATVNVPVATVAPEFLYFLENSNGQNPVAAIEPNGAYIGTPGLISGASFAPAKAGDVVTAFGVGWGPTTSTAPPGSIAAATATLTSQYLLRLGGVPLPSSAIAYAGLSPTFAGLYQIDFTVPSGLTAGNQPLVLTIDGVATSATAYLAVTN
jgi:uncharacterized protein (TIGR03437 family)